MLQVVNLYAHSNFQQRAIQTSLQIQVVISTLSIVSAHLKLFTQENTNTSTESCFNCARTFSVLSLGGLNSATWLLQFVRVIFGNMLFKGMLKWAVGREERVWSQGKRRKLTSVSDYHRNSAPAEVRVNLKAPDVSSKEETSSLLYMTLDHLPLAILRQTDRMLEEVAQLSGSKVTTTTTKPAKPTKPDQPIIRLAHNRSLKLSGPSAVKLRKPKPKLISPEEFNERNAELSSSSTSTSTTDNSITKDKPRIVKNGHQAHIVSPDKYATVPNRGKPKWKQPPTLVANERPGIREPFVCLHNNTSRNNRTPLVYINNPRHDTTDPEFLETSVAYASPPRAKSARKCTIKRSELRKLERLSKKTEKLNRFLKKYYHDCLPNYPEDEDFSPEEKSLLWKVSNNNNNYSDSSSSTTSSSSSSTELWNTTPKRPQLPRPEISVRIPTYLPMIQEDAENSSSISEIESLRDAGNSHVFQQLSPLVMERSPLPNHWECTITPQNSLLEREDLSTTEIYCKLSAEGVEESTLRAFDGSPLADSNEVHEESRVLDPAVLTAGSPTEPGGDEDAEGCSEAEAVPVSPVSPAKKKFVRLGTPCKKVVNQSPRKCVRKPNLNLVTPFTHKGEVLIRTYTNGDYVTLHVVEARNLQVSYRSSWKLAIKISLLPEAEETLTKSEAVALRPNQSTVQIDQKFSFEKSDQERKVFLSFWKRREKTRNWFLGWITLDLTEQEFTECWLKLRKRKMNGEVKSGLRHRRPQESGPKEVKHERVEHHHHRIEGTRLEDICSTLLGLTGEPRTRLQNSSTMDSGVEDCCESNQAILLPPSPSPFDLDGHRYTLRMVKGDEAGFGFSVVWVSPPRIERLERHKTADRAGLRIGDLIIGVNGEDVTTVPNTTIYHKMKTTGNELVLEVWRRNAEDSSGRSSGGTADPCFHAERSSPALISNGNIGEAPPRSPPIFYQPQPSAPYCPPKLVQLPPVSILKPPPPAPPLHAQIPPSPLPQHHQPPQPTSTSASWKIRFNIEVGHGTYV